MGPENKTKQKEKRKNKTREIILAGLYWEQSSTALKQRQYRCSI